MSPTAKIWVRRIYYAAVCAALAVAAVCLMVQCVAIYRLGDSPFTPESIAAHFAPIAVPVYLSVGIVAVGFALSPLLPAAPDSAPDRDVVTLRRLQATADLSACDPQTVRAVCRQRRARNAHHYITLALLAAGTAVFLWYALDVNRFPLSDATGAMVQAMWVLLPCVGVPFAYGVLTAYICRHSVKQEIALLRTAPKLTNGKANTPSKTEAWIPYAQGVALAVGVGLTVYGALHNGAVDMLWKAVNICQECIGLG